MVGIKKQLVFFNSGADSLFNYYMRSFDRMGCSRVMPVFC